MGWFFKITKYLESNKIISIWLLFLICFSFFACLQFTQSFGDPDSFYHIKIAQKINESGAVRDFPYLSGTVLKDNYIDHHFIYHLYLAPFVKFLPPLTGAKLAHIILNSLVILVFFGMLKKFRVKGAFWYSIFLLLSAPFVFRLSLIKAQPLAMIILFTGLCLIASRRYAAISILSFIYVWSYGGWPLMLILAILYAIADSFADSLESVKQSWLDRLRLKLGVKKTINATWIFFRSFTINFFKKENIKLILSVAIGLALGLIINPYFPKNMTFYWFQVIQIAFVNYQKTIGVGAEWYPYGVPDFFKNIAIPLILLIPALVFYFQYFKKYSRLIHWFFLIFLLFLAATIRSRRNIEYLVPITVAFSAIVFAAMQHIKTKELIKFKKILNHLFNTDILVRIIASAAIIAFVIFLSINTLAKDRKYLKHGVPFDRLEKTSEYIKQISRKGDIVFHSDWDDFPALFFYNDYNYYIVGLDPTFMYLHNKDLYFKWRDITLGKRSQNIHEIIKNEFKAEYVIANRENEDFIKNLKNNFFFKEIYADEQAIIYKVQ